MEFVPNKFPFKELKQTKPKWHREGTTWKCEGRVQDTSKPAADKLDTQFKCFCFFVCLILMGINKKENMKP